MCESFANAYRYMLENARLLERRAFEAQFFGASPQSVNEAVRAYMNPDGGLGNALEPDLRCPYSQPLFCEFGLSTLYEIDQRDRILAEAICSYIDTVSDERGLLPPLLESARIFPHAAHWGGPVKYGLNPTLGLCGLMHYHGVEHEWLEKATDTCCALFLADPPLEAHFLLGAARLADNLPDRETADKLTAVIATALPRARFFVPTAPVESYGLTPLHFAPSPQSNWRKLFSDEQVEEHLTDLRDKQAQDGGWPITWNPPAGAAESEWRGRVTLEAIRTLVAYGLITVQE